MVEKARAAVELGRLGRNNRNLFFGGLALARRFPKVRQRLDVKKWRGYWVEKVVEPNGFVSTKRLKK